MPKQISEKQTDLYAAGMCLSAILLIYGVYLWNYEAGSMKSYIADLLAYFFAALPLGYAVCAFLDGKGKRGQMLLGLFAAVFILVLAGLAIVPDNRMSIRIFLPLGIAVCVAAAVYLIMGTGNYAKVKVGIQRLMLIFCLLQTWIIYEMLLGKALIFLCQRTLILLWPVAVYGFFQLSERMKGAGRLIVCFVEVFAGMCLLGVPYLSDTGLKWEIVKACYLLLTADMVIVMENHRRQRGDSGKLAAYGVIALANAGYLIFCVWSSDRIRNILYSLGFTFAEGNLSFQEIHWGSYRMEALWANLSGNQEATVWGKVYMPPLSEMNLSVGAWLPLLILALSCLMLYFLRRIHCENEAAECLKKYLCFAFGLRVVLSFFANLFLVTSSTVRFPLLLDGESDLAGMVLFLFLYFYEGEKGEEDRADD